MILQLIRNLAMAIIRVYEFLLIARAIASWLPVDMSNPIINFLYTVTEPLLAPVRNLLFRIPALQRFPIDFSMIVVFIVLEIIQMLFIY